MNKKILITGGAGFGGSGLAHALVKKGGYDVTVLDVVGPLHADALTDIMDQIKYKWMSLQDLQPQDVAGQEIIIHLAAAADVPLGLTAPRWQMIQNIWGTQELCEACKGSNKLERVIYAGSGNEWGRPLYLPIDEKHPLTPHNPYAWSKACAELCFQAYERCYGLPVVRMSNGAVCGKGMRREIFIYKWLWNIAHNRPCVLEGGDQTRDLTHVDDVLKAWMAAIEAPAKDVIGEKFQVSYGEEVSVADLLDTCFVVTGKPVSIIRKPHRPGEVGQREFFTNEKARRVLGYNPVINYKEAIRRTWTEETF